MEENYQVRFNSGKIEMFETMSDAMKCISENHRKIEKLSFNGPDGTRIRILIDRELHHVTFWEDDEYVPIKDFLPNSY